MSFARRHRLALELTLVAIVAWLAAVATSLGVRVTAGTSEPVPADAPAPHTSEVPLPLAAYAIIAERDVFNPGGRDTGRAAGLRLWGVALHGDEARAVLEDTASGQQGLYRVGDTVGGSRLIAIDWDRVTLADAGGEQVLELASRPGGEAGASTPAAPETTPVPAAAPADENRIRRTGENAFIVDRRALSGGSAGMSGLLTQLRAVAEVRDGRPAGFRLFHIREGSLFARLGLRDGDVVQRVNGSAVSEPAALLGFLERLADEPRVALDIVRADAPRTLVYDLR